MISASGVRIGWAELPGQIRAAVEEILGASVVHARSQQGGFSPGTADRVRTSDGLRAVVKAVSLDQNADAPRLHRQEARITAALPPLVPAPRVLGSYDDGHWVALVLEDVEGRHPVTPWRRDELDLVMASLQTLAEAGKPPPLTCLPTAATALAEDFGGWQRLRYDPPPDLLAWAVGRLDRLCAQADRGLQALDGDTVVHLDVRADNLLIGSDGAVTLVDWPWACLGPVWLDRLMLLVNVRLFGGHDTRGLLLDLATGTAAEQEDLIAVLAGMAGYFLDIARRPAPSGLPTVRTFQRAQGEAVLSWLQELEVLADG